MDLKVLWILGIALLGVVILGIVIYFKRNPKNKIQIEVGEDLPTIDYFEFEKPVPGKILLSEMIVGDEISRGDIFIDIQIPINKEKVDTIPLMVLNRTGFYIIGWLDLDGWILGKEENRWWTHFVSTTQKNYINNPIWENDTHIEHLSEFFSGIRKEVIHSYVVVKNGCELREIILDSDVKVISEKDLVDTLMKDIKNQPILFDGETLHKVYDILEILEEEITIQDKLGEIQKIMKNRTKLNLGESEEDQEQAQDIDYLDEDGESLEKEAIEANQSGESEDLEPIVLPEFKTTEEDEKQAKIRAERRLKKNHPSEMFTKGEMDLKAALKVWRHQQANKMDVSIFEIFDNHILNVLVKIKPKTMDELKAVQGINLDGCDLYGNQLLAMIGHAPK